MEPWTVCYGALDCLMQGLGQSVTKPWQSGTVPEIQLKIKFSVMLTLQNLHGNMPRTHVVTSGWSFNDLWPSKHGSRHFICAVMCDIKINFSIMAALICILTCQGHMCSLQEWFYYDL
jgi:hypothetical protein